FATSLGSEERRTRFPGSPELQEESLTAYEIGYTGTFNNRTTIGLAYYINDTDNNINFTTSPQVLIANGVQPFYNAQNPPPGWPFPAQLNPIIFGGLAQRGIFLPAVFSYLNLGKLRNKGFEASIDHSFNRSLTGFVNYSYQSKPKPVGDN